MEYILNGEVVGRGNTLQINGSGVTGYDLDDGFAFEISSGGSGGITELTNDVLTGTGGGSQGAIVKRWNNVPLLDNGTVGSFDLPTLSGGHQQVPVFNAITGIWEALTPQGDIIPGATQGEYVVTGATQDFVAQGNVRANDGYLSVGGSMTAGMYNVPGGLPQALTGAGAISNSVFQTRWTSTGGAQALSLGGGLYVGQLKKVSYAAEGGFAESGVITPSPASGFSTVTLNGVGDYVVFIWNGAGWTIMEYMGATVA